MWANTWVYKDCIMILLCKDEQGRGAYRSRWMVIGRLYPRSPQYGDSEAAAFLRAIFSNQRDYHIQ
jgi:hypothetical protein